MPTAADSSQHRYTPYTPTQVVASGVTEADVATTVPDTVPHFSMDADDAVPSTVEDYVPPNQEAYFPTSQVDSLFTPTQVQSNPALVVSWAACCRPATEETASAPSRLDNRRVRKKNSAW